MGRTEAFRFHYRKKAVQVLSAACIFGYVDLPRTRVAMEDIAVPQKLTFCGSLSFTFETTRGAKNNCIVCFGALIII